MSHRNSLAARSVRVPAALVDAIVVDHDQRQGYELIYDPAISGEHRQQEPAPPVPAFSIRQIVARRAHEELRAGAVINYGFGIPDEVASIVACRGEQDRYYQTIEHGTYGGTLLTGTLFGYARNPSCMIDGPSQFDFYSGGGLDIAFLGFGEIDQAGNVNVSKLGGLTVGPGGFIDIAQNARKVIFCGTFDTKGAKILSGDGQIRIKRHGEICKLVPHVEQITFSGEQASRQGQEIIYVTERCVFELRDGGLHLIEIAPGVDLQRDILDRMQFSPIIPRAPSLMPAACALSIRLARPWMPERLALIGAGTIGKRHLKAIAQTDAAVLAAIVDTCAETADLAAKLRVPFYRETEDMLRAIAPSGAIVATPTEHHLEPARAVLEAGCHLLIEKPITATVREAEAITSLSTERGLHVLVGHHRRYYPQVEKARQLVRGGALGQLVTVCGQWSVRKPDSYYDADWRRRWQAGPVLTNLVHEIDNLRYIVGDVLSVTGETGNPVQGFEKEDVAAFVLRFTQGALGAFVLSDQADSPWAWELAIRRDSNLPQKRPELHHILRHQRCDRVPEFAPVDIGERDLTAGSHPNHPSKSHWSWVTPLSGRSNILPTSSRAAPNPK